MTALQYKCHINIERENVQEKHEDEAAKKQRSVSVISEEDNPLPAPISLDVIEETVS